MIYHVTYRATDNRPFTVNIEAPSEAKALLVWRHRHPEHLGYRLDVIGVATEGSEVHLRWHDYASEFDERFSSPVVKSAEMGLVILTLIGYTVFMCGGTALGLWFGQQREGVNPVGMASLGLGLGIVLGYVSNVILDWMRSVILLQHEIIERLAREKDVSP